jgi:prepilin-type N-terminal cleavage/methylation domain-containing protein/prepilin-type processing-associated H-X9-DG protein
MSRRLAFTLVELLVVLAIVGVLLGLTAAAVQRVRQRAAQIRCLNNLRQVGLALHGYHGDRGALPPGCSVQNGRADYPDMAWSARLLPYLEQQALWDRAVTAYAQDKFFEAPPHLAVLGTPLPAFACPLDPRVLEPYDFGQFRVGLSSYLGVSGIDLYHPSGVLFADSAVRLTDIADGTSTTLAVGERPPSNDGRFGWWYAGWGEDRGGTCDSVLGVREIALRTTYRPSCPRGPYAYGPDRIDDPCAVFHFWSPHAGGANFLFADGAARFLPYAADPLMPALATRAGGEVVADLDF